MNAKLRNIFWKEEGTKNVQRKKSNEEQNG